MELTWGAADVALATRLSGGVGSGTVDHGADCEAEGLVRGGINVHSEVIAAADAESSEEGIYPSGGGPSPRFTALKTPVGEVEVDAGECLRDRDVLVSMIDDAGRCLLAEKGTQDADTTQEPISERNRPGGWNWCGSVQGLKVAGGGGRI